VAPAVVLGSNGFIGKALRRKLAGGNVRSVGHSYFDLTYLYDCQRAVEGRELVYMCAGVTGGSGLILSDPLSLVTPNVLMHLHLFDACKEAGVKKVVCLSSTTGYPDTDLPMAEDDYFSGEPHPAYFNPGHARRFIERLGAMYPELNIVFLRPSVVYGPGDNYDLETCHMIPALVRKVAERQNPITIWGDGSNWRDAVYIDDMVRALVLAADAPPGAYNIASGEGATVTKMLQMLLHATNYFPQIEYDASKPSMLKRRVLVTDKAHNVLKWDAQVGLEKGLYRTLDWYAQYAR
jgi:GDP-L-fucose synthase